MKFHLCTILVGGFNLLWKMMEWVRQLGWWHSIPNFSWKVMSSSHVPVTTNHWSPMKFPSFCCSNPHLCSRPPGRHHHLRSRCRDLRELDGFRLAGWNLICWVQIMFQWIGLRENFNRKTQYLMGKIDGFRLRLSLKPIHWMLYDFIWFYTILYDFYLDFIGIITG